MDTFREEIGTVYVDAGMVWVGDPCYVLGEDASHPTKEWHDFCELLDKAGQFEGEKRYSTPFGKGIGFAIESGYGDGEYPVYVEKNRDGRVSRVVIDFETDEPEEDEDDWDLDDGWRYEEDDYYGDGHEIAA